MKIYIIRHGATKGNREHRYVGVTDEPLLPEEKKELQSRRMPPVARVYSSPRKRCVETAQICYPKKQLEIVEEFAECDFGIFEYRNYEELNGNPDYQRFIDSMGKSGFPGGEDREVFQKRCLQGLEKIMKRERRHQEDIAFVVHGGTIMALLDGYSRPHGDYYNWQVENGAGYEAEVLWEESDSNFYLENIKKLF
jgi:alpha-ribazole phosphatase